MTSQKRYYELKEAGLCTKCGKNETKDSPSTTRCKDCYQKYLEVNSSKKEERKTSNLCIQCGEDEPVGNSHRCIMCRQHNADLKRNLTKKNKQIVKHRDKHSCRICGQPIDTQGIVCQSCLSEAHFSKETALSRYDTCCCNCQESNPEQLRLVSANIDKPMKKHGSELYREICFSTFPPQDYKVLCFECYWNENLSYIRQMRAFFNLEFETEPDIIEGD